MSLLAIAAVVVVVGFVTSAMQFRGIRRTQEAARERASDPRYEERTRPWNSLSTEQRRVAVAEMRRGRAISDPEAATAALARAQFDTGPSPASYMNRSSALSMALTAIAFIGIGLAADLVYLVVIGGVWLLAVGSLEVWQRVSLARIDRSRQATQALHGMDA